MDEPVHLLDGEPWSQGGWLDPLSVLGCYTSFAVDAARAVVDLDGHLARLREDSAVLHGAALADGLVLDAVRRHLERVGLPVRLRVAVLARTPALQPQDVRSLHVATSSRPLTAPAERPYRVRAIQHVRTLPQVKAVDPFSTLHHKRQARLSGVDDLLYARGDDLLEGTTWGLAALSRTAVVVPVRDVLPSLGAARVAAVAGLPVEHRPVRRDELAGLRLLLATTALHPATAVGEVDGTPVTVDADLLRALRTACAALPGQPLG